MCGMAHLLTLPPIALDGSACMHTCTLAGWAVHGPALVDPQVGSQRKLVWTVDYYPHAWRFPVCVRCARVVGPEM